jgi:hypothetical protein
MFSLQNPHQEFSHEQIYADKENIGEQSINL